MSQLDASQLMIDMAEREALEQRCFNAFTEARTRMLLGRLKGSPDANKADLIFWAALTMNLNYAHDWTIPTACTDGTKIRVNPRWFCLLTEAEQQAVLAHEVGHCILDHLGRRGIREPERFNIAADFAVNPLLRGSGFQLPAKALFPDDPELKKHIPKLPKLKAGESVEYYYRKIPVGEYGPDDGGCGGFTDPGNKSGNRQEDEAQAKLNTAKWKRNINSAAQIARARGTLSGELADFVAEITESKIDWRDVLRNYVRDSFGRENYSWRRPNRMYQAIGLYLPSLWSEGVGGIVASFDCSGSMGPDDYKLAASELSSIATICKTKLTIIYHNTEVWIQEWDPADGEELVLKTKHGGGTDHVCVFDYIDKMEQKPTCFIGFSDMYSDWPEHQPDFPVLWVATRDYSPAAPWGETVKF